jgi:ABC-type transport system involved in cytochrome bd biosynthesis fused ATPase/permease subunit
LEEIINLPEKMKPRVFLLDEWDANLDQSARQSLVEKLFALSKSYLVIEICHNN